MVKEPRTTASPYTPPCWRWASTSSSFGPRVLLFYHVDHSLEFAEWDPRFKHRRLQRGLRRATRHGPPAWGKKSFLLQVNNFFTWDLCQILLKPDYKFIIEPSSWSGRRGTILSMNHSRHTVSVLCLPKVKSCSGNSYFSISLLSFSYKYMFHCSRSPRKASRKISKIPFKVLDAPELQDDFYLNLVRSQTVKFQSNLFGANWTDWEN